jgi:DUF1009 family protein
LKIGLIAGYGKLPKIAAQEILNQGNELVIISLYEEVTEDFSSFEGVEVLQYSVTQVGKVIKAIKSSGATQVVFAGKVNKSLIFSDIKFDLTAMKLLASSINRKDDTEMEANGLEVINQSDVLKSLFLPKGVYSKKKPSKSQMEDIEFGLETAKELGRLDIGQTVVVRDKAVMALEAIEGTDQAVIRGCTLAKKDAVVVKCAKPAQDKRFDIPTVGIDTIRNLTDNGGVVLAIEAGETFVVDIDSCIEFADKNKLIFVVV